MANIIIPGADYTGRPSNPSLGAPARNYSGQQALGQAQRGFMGALTGAIGALVDLHQDQVADELATAKTTYRSKMTALMRELEVNPRKPRPLSAGDEGQESGGMMVGGERMDLPNTRTYDELRKQVLDEMVGSFKYKQARDAFTQFADEDNIARRDAVVAYDTAKAKAVLVDNYTENFLKMVDEGDFEGAKDLAGMALTRGWIDEKMYDDHLDEAAKEIAVKGVLMQTRTMDLGQAMTFLSDAANLKYRTHKNEIRTLDLETRDKLMNRVQTEIGLREKLLLDARRKEFYTVYNEYLDRYVGNTLTIDGIMKDRRSVAFDGQPFALREHFLAMLAAKAKSGDKDPNEETDPALEAEYTRLRLDGRVTPTKLLEWINTHTGVGRDGKPRLGLKFARAEADKVKDKPLDPAVASGVARIDAFYDGKVAGAKREIKKPEQLSLKLNELAGERARALREYSDAIDRLYDKDQKQFIGDKADLLGRNIVMKYSEDDVVKQLRDLYIGDQSQLAAGAGSLIVGIPGLSNAEKVQLAIQRGDFVGRLGLEDAGRVAAQLEYAYVEKAKNMIGTVPTPERTADGQTLLFYETNVANEFLSRLPRTGRTGNFYTFLVDEQSKDFVLKIWNAQLGQWVNVPDAMRKMPYWKAAPDSDINFVKQSVPSQEIQRLIDDAAGRSGGRGFPPSPANPRSLRGANY